MTAVEVKNISKTYPGKQAAAVNDISFSVNRGELFGIIGPDGAGKTTLFRIMTTLLLPGSGSAVVNGHDVVREYASVRTDIGYMPGRFSLYQDLSVEENLNFFATVFGTTVKENYSLISDIYKQIEPFRKRRAGKLSGGMKQKLALCCALIHKPSVLFLDEPTTGVDAVSRKELWLMLHRLKEQEITILVSTPYMDEAVQCNRIALMQQGNILSVDTPSAIISQFSGTLYAAHADDMHALMQEVNSLAYIKSAYLFGDSIHITFNAPADVERFNKELPHARLLLTEPAIEDCFIQLMQK